MIVKGRDFSDAQRKVNSSLLEGFCIGNIGELDANEADIKSSLREFSNICEGAVFYRTYQLLYHKFGNMVIFRQNYAHFVAQETSSIRKLFIFKFFRQKRSKSAIKVR